MENFVLYEEVGRGDHSIIYKGRRKGTINFVSIHCVEKVKRPQITNLVRLTHEIIHHNVVKFHEWYETSNYLWLVVELCTGGSLETVISQDDHLPESSIRKFGLDLVEGLHHLHSLGIIFSDLKPSKILLDGPGVLKFGGFGLSRVESENLDELFEQFAEAGETCNAQEKKEVEPESDMPRKYKTLGSPTYMAPEVLKGHEHSMASDLWSFGCVMFEMYTGHPPFLAENFQDLMDKILHKDVPPLRVKGEDGDENISDVAASGSRVSGKPSPEFQDLLNQILKKDPSERLGWHGLVTHKFWKGQLQHLAKELEMSTEARQSIRESFRRSIANTIHASLTTSDLPKVNSVLGHIQGVEINNDLRRSREHLDELSTMGTMDRPDTAMSDLRPRTAAGRGDTNVAFTLSSRPGTTANPLADDHIPSPQRTLARSQPEVKDTLHKHHDMDSDNSATEELIFHSSDFSITPIVDNPKIQRPGPMKFDPKTLPVPPYSAEKLMKLPSADREKHISTLCSAIAAPEKGPPSQRRIHLLNYTGTIACNDTLANLITANGLLSVLAKQHKDTQPLELKSKLARVLGLIAHNTNNVKESVNLAEAVSVMTDVMRDNFRNSKIKAMVLPALGELIYLISSQEDLKGHPVENWTIPAMTFTFVIRCLREGEDAVINHYAAKVIENIATTNTANIQKLAVNEVGQLLWYAFTHASADTLRITALSALARLSKHSVGVFQNVIEKVGLPKMLSTMALQIPRIQQAVITMFGMLVTSEARLTRLLQDKDFVQQVMRLLESPSAVIRAKAFIVTLEIMKNNSEMARIACQNRLVMYIERDYRKQTLGKSDNLQNNDYLAKCLDMLIACLTDMLPSITKDILSGLDAVAGRKHPSTVQVKQLKSVLPMTTVVQHLVSSQVFRPKIVNNEFIKTLSLFLIHVKSIDAGTTQIKSATGAKGVEEFIYTVFGLVEAIAQHPLLLIEFHAAVIEHILRALAQLVSSSQGDTRALSLRLFSEIASQFLNQAQFDATQYKTDSQKLHQIIADALLPQFEQILLEQDPLPSYGLKLLLALMEQNSAFIRQFEKLGLVPVIFQVLVDHQNSPTSMAVQQIVGIINCLVTHKETNMRELYDQGLSDHMMTLFVDVGSIVTNSDENNGNLMAPTTILLSLLDTMHALLKYVSEVVRKALQAKKGGGDQGSKEAEQAEQLLLMNKPFTDLMTLLTQLILHEDQDISDLALKALSLLVQLFGGEQPNALSQENMECYSEALKKAEGKKQKIILRILKRMISTEKVHADNMRRNGAVLAKTISSLAQTASSHAEVAISTLAAEILKLTGYL